MNWHQISLGVTSAASLLLMWPTIYKFGRDEPILTVALCFALFNQAAHALLDAMVG